MWSARKLIVHVLILVALGACQEDRAPNSGDSEATGAGPTTVVELTLPPATETPAATLPTPGASGPIPETNIAVDLINTGDRTIGWHRPAYLEAEIAGWNLDTVAWVVGVVGQDGRRRLIAYDPLCPESTGGDDCREWSDGVHEVVMIWDAESEFMTSGADGDYVLMWPGGATSPERLVPGRFRRADTDSSLRAELVVDPESHRLVRVIETDTGRSLRPQPGDAFQVMNSYWQEGGQLIEEPGINVRFGDADSPGFMRKPVAEGSYFLGFLVTDIAGNSAEALAEFEVVAGDGPDGYTAYLDPQEGYQFLYPQSWPAPINSDGRLATADPLGTLNLTVSLVPDLSGRPAEELRAQTLTAYGPVEVLYEDRVPVASAGGLWTAYGYEAEDGPHTGVFLAFSQDGIGYVVDLDGHATDESTTLELSRLISSSWLFRPVGAGRQAGNWVPASVEGISFPSPSAYVYRELESDWRRFTAPDGSGFIALKFDQGERNGLEDELYHWLTVASQGVGDFERSDPYELKLSDAAWIRADFSYRGSEGQDMAGFLMTRYLGGKRVTIWTEGEAATFRQLELSRYLLMAIGLRQT